MFAKQVQAYCKNKANVNTSQCKRNMMVYGMGKLNEMEESHLDSMDPYQRDANAIRKFNNKFYFIFFNARFNEKEIYI
jgi:hypothetical protein